jgi:hypothetical protein
MGFSQTSTELAEIPTFQALRDYFRFARYSGAIKAFAIFAQQVTSARPTHQYQPLPKRDCFRLADGLAIRRPYTAAAIDAPACRGSKIENVVPRRRPSVVDRTLIEP